MSSVEDGFLCKEFTIHYYEADSRGFARPVVLLNYLQEAAGIHAALLGVSVADLRKSGHTWVLSRLNLSMVSYPRIRTTLLVRTWPVTRETIFSVRDFELLDQDGMIFGRATTSWAVINLASRRPVRLNDVLPAYPLRSERALPDNFATLPHLENPEQELRLPVLRGDLDLNMHVNNTVYAGWALETTPAEVADNCLLAGIEVGFRAEAVYGDGIVSLACREKSGEGISFLHAIHNAEDGRELARMRTRWMEIKCL